MWVWAWIRRSPFTGHNRVVAGSAKDMSDGNYAVAGWNEGAKGTSRTQLETRGSIGIDPRHS